jgi:hypothetical protein
MYKTGMTVPVRVRLTVRIIVSMCVLIVLIVNASTLVIHLLVRMFVFMPLREVKHNPNAIRPPAITRCSDVCSPRRRMATIAPIKGTSEKYAPVRAVPRWRRPSTERTRLTP